MSSGSPLAAYWLPMKYSLIVRWLSVLFSISCVLWLSINIIPTKFLPPHLRHPAVRRCLQQRRHPDADGRSVSCCLVDRRCWVVDSDDGPSCLTCLCLRLFRLSQAGELRVTTHGSDRGSPWAAALGWWCLASRDRQRRLAGGDLAINSSGWP